MPVRYAACAVLLALMIPVACFESGSSGGGDQGEPCTPGSTKCNDGNVDRCTDDGQGWAFAEECEFGCGGGKCKGAPCAPQCAGRKCGDDGCGGSCGHCISLEGTINDTLCQASGQCLDPCVADCLGRECGPNACGGECGKCESGWVCIQNAQCIPQAVNIKIIDAIIAPGKADGTAWDGFGDVPAEVTAQVAALVSAGSVDKLIDYLVSGAVESLEKPDPLGTAWLDKGEGFGSAVELADEANNVEDTFTPTWPGGGAGWSGVPFADQVKIQVQLVDEDLVNNDSIGTAMINYDQLMEAWAAEEKYWVNVAGQTNKQALFIGILVTPHIQ